MLIGFYTQNTSIRDFRAEIHADLNQFRSEVNARFLGMDQKFADLTGKVMDVDNRLTRVEEPAEALSRLASIKALRYRIGVTSSSIGTPGRTALRQPEPNL